MTWRELFGTQIGPGALCGITFGDWVRLLAANRFAVDPPYWMRAAMITGASLQNSVFSWWEHWRYDRLIAETRPTPPLFILGIWRSGTTHLHNLLSRDARFAYPDFFEVFYPHTFISTRFNRPLLSLFLPERRPQDNVRMAIGEPQEDEFALNCLTQLSWVLHWTLPRRGDVYERYMTFRGCTPGEIGRWQEALLWYVKKLSWQHGGKRLVLKSPAHTGRVKLLLEVFSDARFVHIHRNPYHVFQSSVHSARAAIPWWALQRPDYSGVEETTLRQYEELYQAYFEERSLIPHGRLYEIRYEDLEADPISQLRGLYEGLALGNFDVFEPALRKYLDSIAGYEKNRHRELEPKWKAEVANRWRRSFEEWGYGV